MSRLVETRLLNGPFDDPGLLLDFRFGRQAILFDLGDLSALAPREAMRVTHAFVSHRHMDHFAGFDRLLRLRLYRAGELRVVGPPGIVEGVQAKLHAYVWNLLDEGSADFTVLAAPFAECRLGPWTRFRARAAFRPEPAPEPPLPAGVALSEGDFEVEARTLDHGMPCLCFALQERLRVNVWPDRLAALGLSPGPWLNEAKSLIRKGAPAETEVEPAPGRRMTLGALRDAALRVAPGQRVAYATDLAFTEANAETVVELARDADALFIEAPFLDADADAARDRRHLTARQAGEIARRAGVKRLHVFHHSPRYLDRPDALRQEALAAFRGEAWSAG